MNKEQFAHFNRQARLAAVPGVANLTDRSPRTLLYGYTEAHATHHVYIGQDGVIHVLRYAPLRDRNGPGMGGLAFLVIEHAHGETGGQLNVMGYMPDKRVYPEHSDFEFCKLIEACGVSIPFTGFSDNMQKRQTYQGETLEHGHSEKGINLVQRVKLNRRYYDVLRFVADKDGLAGRLLAQAACDADVPYADLDSRQSVYVAESGVDQVLRNVDNALFELCNTDLLDPIAGGLLARVFGAVDGLTIESSSEYQGCLSYNVSAKLGVRLEGSGYSTYAASSEDYPSGAVVTSYLDHPVITTPLGQGRYRVDFSQFGWHKRFLERRLKQQVAEAAA